MDFLDSGESYRHFACLAMLLGSCMKSYLGVIAWLVMIYII